MAGIPEITSLCGRLQVSRGTVKDDTGIAVSVARQNNTAEMTQLYKARPLNRRAMLCQMAITFRCSVGRLRKMPPYLASVFPTRVVLQAN